VQVFATLSYFPFKVPPRRVLANEKELAGLEHTINPELGSSLLKVLSAKSLASVSATNEAVGSNFPLYITFVLAF
jgi:hypothetical protein